MKDNDNTVLNVLGCVPSLLNILFELACESRSIRNFDILLNIPVDISDEFMPSADWQVTTIPVYDRHDHIPESDLFAFSVVGTQSKEIVYNFFRQLYRLETCQFMNLIHPSSYISRSVTLDHGLQVEPLSVVSSCTTLEFGINVKRGCNIGHHCTIGRFSTINPGVTISSHVHVGNNTMIGSGTTVKDGIHIGQNTIIGAGSVVVRDIPDNVIAFGNPCRPQKPNQR